MSKLNARNFPRYDLLCGADFFNQNTAVRTVLITEAGKMGTNSIVTASITDAAVTTAKILDSNVTIAKLANNVMLEAEVDLTAANIIAMYTTAISVIAAPGAGKAIIVDECGIFLDAGTTEMADGGVVALRYTDTSGSVLTSTCAASVINSTTDAYWLLTPVGFAPLANAAVVVSNATQVFATGNSTATLRIKYHIVTL